MFVREVANDSIFDKLLDNEPIAAAKSVKPPLEARHENIKATSYIAPNRSQSSIPRPKPYICRFENCGKAFTRPCRLDEHTRSHTKERPFICVEPDCGKSFIRSTHLSHHVKSAHSDERNYTCDWSGCQKAFATGTRLRRHQRAHEEKNKFRCKGFAPCSEIFRKQATLDKHIALIHLNQKPFICGFITDKASQRQCQRAFGSTYKLKVHRGREHGGPRYWCTLCPPDKAEMLDDSDVNGENPVPLVGFATNNLLQTHIQTAHPPTCTSCNRSFASARGLRNHHETAHNPDVSIEDRRKFYCDVLGCARSFTRKSNLEAHVRALHASPQNFVCGETSSMDKIARHLQIYGPESQLVGCGATFPTQRLFLAHIRTVHLATAYIAKHGQSKKSLRQAKKKERLEKDIVEGHGSISVFQRLTGVAGSENFTGFDYAMEGPVKKSRCITSGCAEELADDRELQLHMAASHGMTEGEIELAILEKEALAGGAFWISATERGVGGISPSGLHGFVNERFNGYMISESDRSEGYFDEDEEDKEEEEEARRMLDADMGIDNKMKAVELGRVQEVR